MLNGKNIILTGCSRGIGKKMLEVFAANGANVWACLRNVNGEFLAFARQLSEQHQVDITPVPLDLASSESIKSAVMQIRNAKRPVDVLVNNAGITYNALFQMTTMDKLKEVFEINFFAQFQFTQYIVKLMTRQKNGNIINIASSAAIDANSGRSAYGASKAAVICVTKAMAEELAEYHIRANAIAPGITETDMVYESMTESVIAETIMQTKLKRIGKPSDIANAALFLASDLSSYYTGQVLRVDGGL